jgi:hypothetical protein
LPFSIIDKKYSFVDMGRSESVLRRDGEKGEGANGAMFHLGVNIVAQMIRRLPDLIHSNLEAIGGVLKQKKPLNGSCQGRLFQVSPFWGMCP